MRSRKKIGAALSSLESKPRRGESRALRGCKDEVPSSSSCRRLEERLRDIPDSEDTWLANDQKVGEGMQGWTTHQLQRVEDEELEVGEEDPVAVKGRELGRYARPRGGGSPVNPRVLLIQLERRGSSLEFERVVEPE